MVWGELNPTDGEHSIPWPTWDDGSAGPVTVTGDPNWGQLDIASGSQGLSNIIDLGAAYTLIFTLTENKYEAGSGTGLLQIRGSTIAFTQDDILPAWEDYTIPVLRTWRYVQARESKDLAGSGGKLSFTYESQSGLIETVY